MRIGVLQCDDVAEPLRNTHGNYPEQFERLLTRLDPTLEFRVWRCLDDEIPAEADLGEVDAWLITGSKYGVNDGAAWIERLCVFVRRLWAQQHPLVGVCFGHQLIARALHGEVEQSPRGWGLGVSLNRLTERAEWMEPYQTNLDLLVSHQDQVKTLPPQTRVLAGSDFCPFFLMQVGKCFLGIQGHPEFTKAYASDLMTLRGDHIPAQRVREGQDSLSTDVNSELMARWMLNFWHQALRSV